MYKKQGQVVEISPRARRDEKEPLNNEAYELGMELGRWPAGEVA